MMVPLACLADTVRPVWDSSLLKGAPVAPKEECAVTERTLLLSGPSALQMDAGCLPEKMAKFSVSAWVKPVSFDPYNEIFRVESNEGRVLFSFQEKGTVLSLGLFVNGNYQECDAPIRPDGLLDGGWHFVAATFDGKEHSVYLDGARIGRLPHAGDAVVARAPGFVGSAGGGECFQGGLDDVRLYTEALTPAAIADQFKAGAGVLTVRSSKAVPAEWQPFLNEKPTFAATLLEARAALKQGGRECPAQVRNLFAMNLAARFPEACGSYVRLFRQSPALFATLPDLAPLKGTLESQVTRLTEYMPLTDAQWAHCSAADKKRWQEIKGWSERMAAQIPKGGETLAPVLLEAVSANWPEVPERPSASEPVAPYVPPATPAVRTYTPEEARTAIERDWLRQVGDKPDLAHEIVRTLAVAARLGLKADGLEGVAAEASKGAISAEKTRELYLAVRRIRRALMLHNPAVDFSQLLMVDMPYPEGSEWMHETRHRLGYMAVPGGQLLVVDGLNLDGKVRRLMPQEPLHGSFWRSDLSFDGKRVLFCFKPHNEKSFHIYEINADGTGLRQITSGIYDDFDPVYLPDGKHFVFSPRAATPTCAACRRPTRTT